MRRLILFVFLLCTFSMISNAQIEVGKFGKGLKINGADSSFYMKLGFRFQNLFVGSWTGSEGNREYDSNFLIRRSRIKMDGWVVSPRLKYKAELALTNRDTGGGSSDEFRNTSNVVLDAWVRWNFFENFWIQFGQGKLPSNRERVISSGNLQLVDRSRLNSRFTLDRDVGLQLKHNSTLGGIKIYNTVALSQGEGRNVTGGHYGGYDYTFHTEWLPFGDFQSKGHYVGSAIKKESKPKLAIAAGYNINKNSVRERGQLGSFIQDSDGNYIGKDVYNVFTDFMFKYKGLSVMGEYSSRSTDDQGPDVLDSEGNVIGTYYIGNAFNIQTGYLMNNNWELAVRYTDVNPDALVDSEQEQYTIGLSKFVVGHKLKFQTDFTIINQDNTTANYMWRSQVELHF